MSLLKYSTKLFSAPVARVAVRQNLRCLSVGNKNMEGKGKAEEVRGYLSSI